MAAVEHSVFACQAYSPGIPKQRITRITISILCTVVTQTRGNRASTTKEDHWLKSNESVSPQWFESHCAFIAEPAHKNAQCSSESKAGYDNEPSDFKRSCHGNERTRRNDPHLYISYLWGLILWRKVLLNDF